MEICPYCKKEFEACKNLHHFGITEAFTPRMPSTRLAQNFTVRCPSCGNIFISTTLRLFGIVSYAQMPWLLGVICGLFILFAWLF